MGRHNDKNAEESFSGIIGLEERKAERKKKTKRRVGDIIATLVLIIALTIVGVAGYKLYSIFMEYKAGADEYSSITDAVVTERDASEEEIREMEEVDGVEVKHWTPPINVDFDQLRDINSDVVGWLYMEALSDVINYPIVKGIDNEFYLHHTYKKEDVFAGSIFIDCKNSGDFSDQNTIVYGHNMKDGSMFGTLKQYKLQETVDKSPFFWILTPKEAYKYRIFAIYTASAGGDTYTLIKGPGPDSADYLQRMLSKTDIDMGDFSFSETDKAVTLSTCTGDSSTRFVVQGVRVNYPARQGMSDGA